LLFRLQSVDLFVLFRPMLLKTGYMKVK
jgi:hypothetical protein